jgi:hypothetical protein
MPTNPIPDPLTANEEFLDALVRHQTFLMRGVGSIRNQANILLNATEAELARLISKTIKGDSRAKDIQRSVKLLEQIRELRGIAWKDVRKLLRKDFKEVVNNEYAFLTLAAITTMPVILDVRPAPEDLGQDVVTNAVYEGKTLNQWGRSLERADIDRIGRAVRVGIIQGSKGPEIAKGVIGTSARRGRDGLLQTTRRQLESTLTTSMTSLTQSAGTAFAEANDQMITEEIYTAVLDSSTTDLCISLDGNIYKVGEGRFPAVHFGCRSKRIAIFEGRILAKRPYKEKTDRKLLNEFTDKHRLPRAVGKNALSDTNQFRFDSFARRRVNELVGGPPKKISYSAFLKRQSVEFQNDTLGVTQARLFRDGGLSVDKFVNRAGDELTLSEIAKRDPEAFKAAGLDPEEF